MSHPCVVYMLSKKYTYSLPRTQKISSTPISTILMSTLQGRGVTNYNTEKPSYAFTAETTEFDDQLIQRKIVTLEAAIMAKGATQNEAERLANVTKQRQHQRGEGNPDKKLSQQEDDDFDDDDFMRTYRRDRLEQLMNESQQPRFGDVIPISRPEWTHHVNEASTKSWVVVCLTADKERTGCVEGAIAALAVRYPFVKFTSIHHQAAILNWPEDNLPTLFVYRDGKMQHQLLTISSTISAEELEWKLSELTVLETLLEQEPTPMSMTSRQRGYVGISLFGGTMSALDTRSLPDTNDDYNEVD